MKTALEHIVRISLTGLLIVSAAQAADRKKQPPDDSKATAAVQTHELEGIWEQRFVHQGRWQVMLQSEVILQDGSLSMNVLNQKSGPTLIPSLGISNVRHVVDTWTFDSDWGSYGTGNFVLKQQSKDNFTGYAFQDGVERGANEWIRVANLMARHQKTSNGRLVNIYESNEAYVITLVNVSATKAANEPVGFDYQHPKLVLRLQRNSGEPTEPRLFSTSSWTIPRERVNRITDVDIRVQ